MIYRMLLLAALAVPLGAANADAQMSLNGAGQGGNRQGPSGLRDERPPDAGISCNDTHCYCHVANGFECSTMAIVNCSGDLEPYGIGGVRRCEKKDR